MATTTSSTVTGPARTRPAPASWPSPRTWTRACVLAETVGMTAAATAAAVSRSLGGSTAERLTALGLAVAGGLVEGTALGVLQGRALRPVLGPATRRWTASTVLVAGVGWATASAPGALVADTDSSSGGPALLLVLPGAAVLGALLGALLGAAQATALRGVAHHRWRWVGVSALAWTPAMVVVFVFAGMPGASWPGWTVVLLGTLTGLLAGATLGVTSGWLLPSLTGARPHDLFVLRVLEASRGRVLGRRVVGLRLRGAVSGRVLELPVMYAVHGERLVVVPGHATAKHWWHNLAQDRLTAIEVLHRGSWRSAVAEVLGPGSREYDAARHSYQARWSRVQLPDDQPVVVVSAARPDRDPRTTRRRHRR